MKFLIPLLLFVASSHAATLYCSPSGGGSGADFNNLATLPTTTGFTRGNTYIIVEGSYGSKTLSTATSGSSTITIKKASAADSAVAGYSSSLHDAVASFGTITVATRYWIINGVTRTEPNGWAAPANYGISATQIYADSNEGHDADFSEFHYMDLGSAYAENPSAGTIAGYGEAVFLVYNQTDILISRCAMHNGTPTLLQGSGLNNLTVEYCHIGPGWGKEALRGGNGNTSSGWIVRHNRFWDSSQTNPNDGSSGITAEIGMWGWTGTATGNQIYGNWFSNSKMGARNATIVVGGDGAGWAGDGANGTVVYNNTFAGIDEASVFPMIDLNGSSTIARNNLFYDCVDTDVSASTTSDNDVSGADIFQSYATFDLRLSQATSPGFTLSSPYNTDPTGETRGTDGTWDVGAYEYDEGGSPPPQSSAPVARGIRGIRLRSR